MTNELIQFVVFVIDDQAYAVRLGSVHRIVHAVEVTALPGAPVAVMGIIDVEGQVIPVLNLRHRFSLAQRPITPIDQFLIAQIPGRMVAMVIDSSQGVIDIQSDQICSGTRITSGLEYIQGVIKIDRGLILIHELETFLSFQEEAALEQAIASCPGGAHDQGI